MKERFQSLDFVKKEEGGGGAEEEEGEAGEGEREGPPLFCKESKEASHMTEAISN